MGLSTRIFIGLFAGIATGLFFGELVGDLKIVGDVFVKLLQMTVLPYIVVSLVAGFGRMDAPQARRLAIRGAAVLGIIWLVALLIIFAAPLAFPDRESASFFASPTMTTGVQGSSRVCSQRVRVPIVSGPVRPGNSEGNGAAAFSANGQRLLGREPPIPPEGGE